MKFVRALAMPVLAAGLLTIAPQAAYGVVDQVCAAQETVTYHPPVTNTPQKVTITVKGQLFNCTSTSNPTGSYTEKTIAPNATCVSLLSSAAGTRTYVWGNPNNQPSVFKYNRTVTRLGALVETTFLGSITSGSYMPSPAKQVNLSVPPDPVACLTTGVSTLTTVGVVSIGI